MERTIVLCDTDYEIKDLQGLPTFDVRKMEIAHCCGCWSCWLATPGRCIHKDLDDYYTAYVNADRVICVLEPEKEFISVAFKKLLDRMCPLFMPYVEFHQGGSGHTKRYDHYPEVVVYYKDNFTSDVARKIFTDYVNYTFEQFAAPKVEVMPLSVIEGGVKE